MYGRGMYMKADMSDEKKILTSKKDYGEYVKQVTPKSNLLADMFNAFIVGGIICTLGQILTNMFMRYGMEKETANAYTLLVLIGLTVILTGINVFPGIVKFGGAGALVPITGFANSVASPAIEYKAEGQVFGIGCKIFTIAGPVILYGVLSSWGLGLIYWIWSILV